MTVDDDLRTAADRLLQDTRATVDSGAALDRTMEAGGRRPRAGWLAAAVVLLVVGLAAVAVAGARTGDEPDVATDTTGAPTTDGPVDRPDVSGPAVGGPADGTASAQLPVTATPDTDLVEGQEVRVEGDGFTPGAPVGVVMCVADALSSGTGSAGCDLTQIGAATVDGTGHAEGTIVVRRGIATTGAGWVDCAAGEVPCGIAIGQVDDYDVSGLAPVTFAPQPPIPPLVLTVDPADDLVHGQTVTVTGEGFEPGASLPAAQQCVDGTPAPGASAYSGGQCLLSSLGAPGDAIVDDDGRFTLEVEVWRTVPGPGGAADCAVDGCHIRMDERGRTAVAALHFDPEGPVPPAPTMTATPTTDLTPGDEVVVTVEGLPAGQAISVHGCGQLTEGGVVTEDGCPPAIALGEAVADEAGRVVVTVVAPDPAPYGVDCVREGQCGLTFFAADVDTGDPAVRPQQPVVITYTP